MANFLNSNATLPAGHSMRSAILSTIALAMLGLSPYAHANPTYIYTDPQGTPVAEADSSGNITATFDHKPYGQIASGTAPDGIGYTGHVEDPDSQMVYMQARYYDPTTGRFISVDPERPDAGNDLNFGRFTYAGNNPLANVDVNGRSCSRTGNFVTCIPTLNGQALSTLPVVTFKAPSDNWPKTIDSSVANYHSYIYSTPIGDKSPESVAQSTVNDPTGNDHDKPATSGGTLNDATPSFSNIPSFLARAFQLASPGISAVTSYSITDANGGKWALNVTMDSHVLSYGYVLRGVVQGDLVSYGEGNALLQNLGRFSEKEVDDVWILQNQKNIDESQ